MQILKEESGQGAFEEAAVQARARAIQKEKSTKLQRDPHAAAAQAMQAQAKLTALYQVILDKRVTEIADIEDLMNNITTQIGSAAVAAKAEPPPRVPDIVADLQARSCPVCRHIEKYVFDFFAHWQYRISIEEQAQATFAAELGFCPLHTWQLLAVSSPHGASVGYARLVEQIGRSLAKTIAAPAGGDAVRRLVRDSQNCRICGMIRQAETEFIQRLAALIGEAAGRNQYRRSQGVCLRHLGMLIDAVSSIESQEFLLSQAIERFEEDAEDMRSYAMKHEAIRRALQNQNEADAYRRAIVRIVGARRVCTPWAEGGEI